MEKIRFHEKWFYAYQSYEFASAPVEPFCEVTIPHDAMIHEERVKDLPGGRNTGYYPYASYECMMDKRPEKDDQEEESKDVNEAMTKGQHVFKSLITSPEVASFVEEAMGIRGYRGL